MITSILWAVIGGVLIGLAASWLLLSKGRIAGISGILGGLLEPWGLQSAWRLSFLIGLLSGGGVLAILLPSALVAPYEHSSSLLAIAGVFVGYGTRLGRGCTSGHGVCGLSRLSARSLVATLTFMATGSLTATLIGLLR